MMKVTKIRDIAKVRRGASPRPIDDPKYFGGEVGWVRIADVTASNKYLRRTTDYVSPLGEAHSVRVDKGDLIISIAGTVGRPIIVDMAACIHDGFVQIFDLKETETEYLYYFLKHVEKGLYRFGQSGTQTNLNSDIVGNIELNWFPKLEQARIAEILSTADGAIARTEALIAKYQRIKTGLMQDLLTRGIDANGNIRSKATHRFVVKNGIEVPEEWEIDLLMTNAEVYGGKRLPSGHSYSESSYGFKYLRVLDFFKKDVDYYSLENLYEETFEALKRYEIKPGELFISIAGSIGYIGVLRPTRSDRFILTENALRIIPSDKIIPEYLSLLMNSETVQKQIWSETGTGGGVPKLALHRVQSLKIYIPNKIEQKCILDIIQANDDYLKNLNTNLNKLHALKSGLMQDLLSGRVRVKVNNG